MLRLVGRRCRATFKTLWFLAVLAQRDIRVLVEWNFRQGYFAGLLVASAAGAGCAAAASLPFSHKPGGT